MIIQFPDQKSRETAAKEETTRAMLALRREFEIKSRLPFVGPPGPLNRHGFAKQNFWVDEPTDDCIADRRRGERYGRMTIEAIQERSAEHDGHKLVLSICAIDLEHIIEGMIRDGIARQKKGGKYSRSVCTSTMEGFLSELTRYIAGLRDERSS